MLLIGLALCKPCGMPIKHGRHESERSDETGADIDASRQQLAKNCGQESCRALGIRSLRKTYSSPPVANGVILKR